MEQLSGYSSQTPCTYRAIQAGEEHAVRPDGRAAVLNPLASLNNSTQELTGRDLHALVVEERNEPAHEGCSFSICKSGGKSAIKAAAIFGLMLTSVGAGISIFGTRSNNNISNEMNPAPSTAPTTMDEGALTDKINSRNSHVYREIHKNTKTPYVPFNFGLG